MLLVLVVKKKSSLIITIIKITADLHIHVNPVKFIFIHRNVYINSTRVEILGMISGVIVNDDGSGSALCVPHLFAFIRIGLDTTRRNVLSRFFFSVFPRYYICR